jgi:hypothetical protein
LHKMVVPFPEMLTFEQSEFTPGLLEEKKQNLLGAVVHVCNPSTLEAEADGSRVLGQPGLCTESTSKNEGRCLGCNSAVIYLPSMRETLGWKTPVISGTNPEGSRCWDLDSEVLSLSGLDLECAWALPKRNLLRQGAPPAKERGLQYWQGRAPITGPFCPRFSRHHEAKCPLL